MGQNMSNTNIIKIIYTKTALLILLPLFWNFYAQRLFQKFVEVTVGEHFKKILLFGRCGISRTRKVYFKWYKALNLTWFCVHFNLSKGFYFIYLFVCVLGGGKWKPTLPTFFAHNPMHITGYSCQVLLTLNSVFWTLCCNVFFLIMFLLHVCKNKNVKALETLLSII